MTQRRVLTTIGAAALGVGVVLGGAATMPALAQDATPPVTAPAASTTGQTSAQPASDQEAQRAQAYDQFVASLAKELGDDESTVDASIRTTLKQQVDARQTAGDIDKVQAAAMKAAIDASDAPLFLGLGGPGGMHGGNRGDGAEGFGPGRGPRGGAQSQPAAQPGNEAPANQSGSSAAPATGADI